ncbi:MAG: WD40 repeat domain-containing protein [Gemmatimonadales bacterium]
MRVQRFEHGAGGVTELALDAEGGHLVVGDDAGVLRIWQLGDHPTLLRDVEPPFTFVDGLDWLADRSGFVAAGPEGIGAWTLDGNPVGSWPTIEAASQSVAVVDEKHALVAYDDGRLRLIDFRAGAVLSEAVAGERNSGIARHPDGHRFAISACDQGGSIICWVTIEGLALQPLEAGTIERNVDHISAPAVDAGGRMLMAADHRLGLFDVGTGRRLHTFDPDGRRSRWRRFADGLLVEKPWTQCVAVGPSGLGCASPTGPVYVFDTSTERLAARSDLTSPATALTADGDVLAAATVDWDLVLWWP